MEQHHDAGATTAVPGTITMAIEMRCEQSGHTVPQSKPSPTPVRRARQRPATPLVISPQAQLFRKRFFPTASTDDWNDWRWQLRHRIKNLDTLASIIRL